MVYDVIVVGKGPAGITASIYAARGNLKTLVIGEGYGDLIKAKEIENYYGFEKAISGKDLLDRGINQAKNLGVEIVEDEVVGISYDTEFILKIVKDEYKTKSIVLATGAKRGSSKIKGIEEYEGKGISYCAICDGFFFRGKDVAVLGNGEYALSEVLELVPIVNNVTILTNGLEAKETRHPKISVNSKKIREFRGDTDKLSSVEFEDDTSMDIAGIFIAEGTAASTDLAKKIGAEINGRFIKVDENMKTNIPGIFACGDCTGGLSQITKAVYEGTKAGLSAIEFVKKINHI